MWRKWLCFLGIITWKFTITAQELPVNTQQQLESFSEKNETEYGDDLDIQDLEYFRKNPVDLNSAGPDELKELKLLSELQVENLLRYRETFGLLRSIYELQAIPGWDLFTIRKIVPFTYIGKTSSLLIAGNWLKSGEHSLLTRVSRVLEKSKGYTDPRSLAAYQGNPYRFMIRYRYKFKNQLQYGFVLEKDPGEKGIDFSSFHLLIRKPGIIREIVFGDFTVNLGQGLVIWQGMSYFKSGEISSIKQQASPFRPYHSSGEFFFSRGAGFVLQVKKSALKFFISKRNLSATTYLDSARNESYFSSFNSSGYHRTVKEISYKGSVSQLVYGGGYLLKLKTWEAGINGAAINYSLPLIKKDELYILDAINGKYWYNLGMHYSLTRKNFHFFGEASLDKRKNLALLNGLMLSVDSRADLAILQRIIPAGYQAPLGNGFTENSTTTNETGIYYGLCLRPVPSLKMDFFADLFSFPWMKFRVDAPSGGKEMYMQLTYAPNRKFEIWARYKLHVKQLNGRDPSSRTNILENEKRTSLRTHLAYQLSRNISMRERVECLWYRVGSKKEQGYLAFSDFIYQPMMSKWGIIFRYSLFETSGYSSRLYAYENDVLYGASVPAFYGRGVRCYLNLDYKLTEKLTVWLKLSRTYYRDQAVTGSGAEEIKGNRKTELKFQIRYSF